MAKPRIMYHSNQTGRQEEIMRKFSNILSFTRKDIKLHNSSSRGMSQSRKLMLDGGSEGERVVGDYIFLSWPGPGPVLGLF